MIERLMATAGPLPSDIQPVENETRDRIITGLVTMIPFVAIGLAGWQVWGSALHLSDIFLFLGWAIGGTIFAALTGLLWGGLVRVFVLHHFTYSINSLCHVFGVQEFETTDQSRNLALIAIPTLGEAYHNSHHAFPTSSTHGLRWWQIDISAIIIDVWEKLGLVWDVVRVSPERLAAKAASPS